MAAVVPAQQASREAAMFVIGLMAVLPCASGHAYVYWPASRNLLAAPHIAHCFNVPGPPVNFETAHRGGEAGPSDFAKGMCGNFANFGPKSTIAEDGIANWPNAAPVATYQSGGDIQFTIVNNAEHGGQYEFRLCDRKLDASIGSREDAARCFDAHFLGRRCVPLCGCGSDRCKANAEHNSITDPIYSHGEPRHLQQGGHQVTLQLPLGLTCEHCTIQWFWHTAWGEQFWNCIDIRIEGGGGGSLPPTLPMTTTLATTTAPSSGGGGDAGGTCVWTTPSGRTVTMRKQSEKPGRICWEFEVPMGTVVHYQSKVDIYHSWNADTCCLVAGTSAAEGPANVVTFAPAYGTFGFCECIGWNPSTGATSCAGQATAANMICPVAGSPGDMCLDRSAAFARPSSCGSVGSTVTPTLTPTSAPPGTTAPVTTAPPDACASDWSSCLSSRCCASSHFTCYEEDASFAQCRSDGCPAGWSCNVLSPPGVSLPEICADFCHRASPVASCSAFADEATCTNHYVQVGTRSVPCSWTGCGDCFADGGGVLDCPNLHAMCASGCSQLCGKEDLTLTGRTCGDLSDNQAGCTSSYISKVGLKMLCKWTDCMCFADGEASLQCDTFNDICLNA